MATVTPSTRLTLRDLPIAARVVITAFLFSVLLGYLAAIVQLKIQLASPGNPAPTAADVIGAYSGVHSVSQLQRVLEADEGQPFNGQGSMRGAFTQRKPSGWEKAVKAKGKETNLNPKVPDDRVQLDKLVLKDRDGERLALIDWIKKGASEEEYKNNAHLLTDDLAKLSITEDLVDVNAKGERFLKVQDVLQARCTRCHSSGTGGAAGQYPLDNYEDIQLYLKPEHGGGMSLPKLAQTTHVHLLGFSMLWGFIGLLFTFTSYPMGVRLLLGPWVIVAQIIDISCWWLARLEGNGPIFAQTIMVTGALVAAGLLVQVAGILWDLYDKRGKIVLLGILLLGGLMLGTVYAQVVAPYLKAEMGQMILQRNP